MAESSEEAWRLDEASAAAAMHLTPQEVLRFVLYSRAFPQRCNELWAEMRPLEKVTPAEIAAITKRVTERLEDEALQALNITPR